MAEYDRRHLDLGQLSATREFRSPKSPPRVNLGRNRRQHGRRILAELESAFDAADEERENRDRSDWTAPSEGIYLEVEVSPNASLQNLERKTEGTRQGAVTIDENGAQRVALFVKDETRPKFESVFRKYAGSDRTKGGNIPLKDRVESIEHIRAARLGTFWRDDPKSLPSSSHVEMWWALWCFKDSVQYVEELGRRLKLTIGAEDTRLRFPEVIVLPVHARRSDIETLLHLTGGISEIRKATDTPSAFIDELSDSVTEFTENLAERITWPGRGAELPAVCLLDTGVNRAHPLIEPALASDDMHAVVPAWGVDDHHETGHGSGMAGIALHGDLTAPLGGASSPILSHRMESVKILPPKKGFKPNDPSSYGAITASATALPEIQNPARSRVYCSTVTNLGRSGAEPSGWSASIDQICSGANVADDDHDQTRRLFVQAIGNIPDSSEPKKIANFDAFPGEDPAQAWNAVTVGGVTMFSEIFDKGYEDWSAMSEVGDLSPYSRTTTRWGLKHSPVKPEVVFEAGNRAISKFGTEALAGLPSLSLLTTSNAAGTQPVMPFWATSAATAQAGRMAARIMAEHPDYWPETVRALMAHSARWTPRMRSDLDGVSGKNARKMLTRRFGCGVPNLLRANASAGNDLVLVAQQYIQPFRKEKGNVSFGDAHVYRLPWPRGILEELGETRVLLKATLSYFIEPNPSWATAGDPARYRSYGLGFDLKRPQETEGNFLRRVNKNDRKKGEPKPTSETNDGWFLGSAIFSSGSIHVDIWEGSAIKLASRDLLYVYPRSGWWRERKSLGKAESQARYSLIVGIETPDNDIDLMSRIEERIAELIQSGIIISGQ